MTRRGGYRPSNADNSDFRSKPSTLSEKSAKQADEIKRQPEETTDMTAPVSGSGGDSGGGFPLKTVLALLVGAPLVIIAGAAAGYYLFTNLYLGLSLNKQPGSVYLPIEFDATASITNNMDIIMDGVIEAQVPFKQTLNLPLQGRYKADVEIDAPVPVKFDVVYDGTIPVDTIADITARANFNFQDVKTYRELEFQAKLPMKMALPVKLTAPVDTTIDFKYKGPLVMGLNQTIQADVDTTLDTRLAVNQTVSTPVNAAIPLHIYAPSKPINVFLSAPQLRLDISKLKLEVAEDTDQPQRTESPWGPPAEGHPQAATPDAENSKN